MNTRYENDLYESAEQDREISLSTTSILGIFFALALLCAVFFGFGYSMGRRNSHATAPAASTSPIPANELSGAPLKPQTDGAAPPEEANAANPDESKSAATKRPAQDDAETSKPAKAPAPPAASSKTTRVAEATTPDPSLNAVPFTHRAPLPSKPHAGVMAPLAQAPGDSPIVPGQPIMVQIAAVSRQEDAEVLAGALRKRGFNPTVRPGTGDKFFHVQVGPFTDKTQADAMKQHLLADGYNAIVK